MYKTKYSFLFISVICLIVFLACNNNTKKNANKKVFKYNESAGLSSLDPAFAKDQSSMWPINQLFNGLVQMNNKLEVIPCIAKSWQISADGLNYTFILRNDVYFHDHALFANGKGRKVIAKDFVNSFFRLLDDQVSSPGSWIFNYIDKSEKSGYLGFEAINDTVFKMYLTQPYPPMLGLLTMQYCSVVPNEVVEHYGKEFRSNPVGTGPFKFKLWKEGVKLVLLKNENYFEKDVNNKKLPYLDAVAISFNTDKQTEFLDFIKGNIDLISGLDGRGTYKDELFTKQGTLNSKYTSKLSLASEPYLNTEYIGFNLDNVAITNKEKAALRKAIGYCIDRRKIVSSFRNNVGQAAEQGICPIGLPSFTKEVKGFEYDLDKARNLLASAGFANGKGLPEIIINCTEKRLDIFEFIQSSLLQIGIKSKIDVNPSAIHRQMVAKGTAKIFWASWIADYPDAENYFSLFYSPNKSPKGPNTTRYSNKLFDKLYEQALLTNNNINRYRIYKSMDSLLMQNAVVCPLYYDQMIRLYPKEIKGLEGNAINLLSLKEVQK